MKDSMARRMSRWRGVSSCLIMFTILFTMAKIPPAEAFVKGQNHP